MMPIQLHPLECSYCGKIVPRANIIKIVCCFDCRTERQREISLEWFKKKRAKQKKLKVSSERMIKRHIKITICQKSPVSG